MRQENSYRYEARWSKKGTCLEIQLESINWHKHGKQFLRSQYLRIRNLREWLLGGCGEITRIKWCVLFWLSCDSHCCPQNEIELTTGLRIWKVSTQHSTFWRCYIQIIAVKNAVTLTKAQWVVHQATRGQLLWLLATPPFPIHPEVWVVFCN